MTIHIQYLGITGEITGKSHELLEQEGNLSHLLESLHKRYPDLEKCSFVVARNDQIRHDDPVLLKGDRISLIPPAPGG